MFELLMAENQSLQLLGIRNKGIRIGVHGSGRIWGHEMDFPKDERSTPGSAFHVPSYASAGPGRSRFADTAFMWLRPVPRLPQRGHGARKSRPT